MQVTLSAVDWERIASFPSIAEFFEWWGEIEDLDQFREVSCYDHGWPSDSATEYFQVARLLQHLESVADPETAGHLRAGIRRLITERGHIDELGMSPVTDGCYWISASPAAVHALKAHIEAIDPQQCVALLTLSPPPDVSELAEGMSGFVGMIEQHARMVHLAAAEGLGLLGHCG